MKTIQKIILFTMTIGFFTGCNDSDFSSSSKKERKLNTTDWGTMAQLEDPDRPDQGKEGYVEFDSPAGRIDGEDQIIEEENDDLVVDDDSYVETPEPTPEPDPGRWYPTNGGVRSDVCADAGKTWVPSPEGAYCTSGEDKMRSARDQTDPPIPLIHGTTDAGIYESFPGSYGDLNSQGPYCYFGVQVIDNDATDITIGCFCD